MNFDYSPFNLMIWGVFIAVLGVIWVIGNSYRKKYRFGEDDRKQ